MFSMQVFDAGDKLFIGLEGCADDASEAGEREGEDGGGEQEEEEEERTAPSRKVVVREDYVQDGEDFDIFLVDREFTVVVVYMHSNRPHECIKRLRCTGCSICGHQKRNLRSHFTTDAWTFQAGSAREQLYSSEPLLQRMSALMQVAEAEGDGESDGGGRIRGSGGGDDGVGCRERKEEKEKTRVLEGVLAALPTFSRRYGLGRAGLHVSYVNDELGSAFRHSESPNCQVSEYVPCVGSCCCSLSAGFIVFGVVLCWRWSALAVEAVLAVVARLVLVGRIRDACRGEINGGVFPV